MMFNEVDYEALEEAVSLINETQPWSGMLRLAALVNALDAAGINGLVHDGTRVMRKAVE